MKEIDKANPPTSQPIAHDSGGWWTGPPDDEPVETPIFDDYEFPDDRRDNHNDSKGGALHLSGLPASRQGHQSQTLASSLTWREFSPPKKSPPAVDWWSQCESLARQPNILDQFEEALKRFVVGEGPVVRLLYLALVSRFLDRPVSIAVKGPASCGKSFLTQQVLRFFPPSAYYVLTAMSDKALAYSEEPVKHRFIVMLEAAGLQGEGASYLMRSLLSEGHISYETVERTNEGLRPLRIEREGPTGLITTTTAISLHPENETRYFSVEVDDTPEQTSRVLLATAENINKDNRGNCEEEIGKFLGLQGWLAENNHEVVIPYANHLAGMIPPVAVRLRRDFTAILYLIMSHAILHQATRTKDARGRIIATLEDYRAVRDIVAPTMSQALQMTASDTMRQTVEAVREVNKRPSRGGNGASVKQVAEILKLDVSSTSRRVDACVERRYLRNLETKRGSAFRLVVGDPLPGEVEVLPDPESLEGCCSVAADSGGIGPPPPCSKLSGSAVLETKEEP